MQNFRNLQVWQKSHQLALNTYEVPAYLLKPEAWPLRDQILRAAISIPSNIAEGTGRGSASGFSPVPVALGRFVQRARLATHSRTRPEVHSQRTPYPSRERSFRSAQ